MYFSIGCPSCKTVFSHNTSAPIFIAFVIPSSSSPNTQSMLFFSLGFSTGVIKLYPFFFNSYARSEPLSLYPPSFIGFLILPTCGGSFTWYKIAIFIIFIPLSFDNFIIIFLQYTVNTKKLPILCRQFFCFNLIYFLNLLQVL